MAERYIYEEKLKPGRNKMGYGKILDSTPKKPWEKEIVTVYGRENTDLLLTALNLRQGLLSLKKGCSKKEILTLLKKYKIEL